jgi:hypothetical protein
VPTLLVSKLNEFIKFFHKKSYLLQEVSKVIILSDSEIPYYMHRNQAVNFAAYDEQIFCS